MMWILENTSTQLIKKDIEVFMIKSLIGYSFSQHSSSEIIIT